jgi:hypothetical protein
MSMLKREKGGCSAKDTMESLRSTASQKVNAWPISELHGDWGGRFHPNSLNSFLPSNNNGMSSPSFSSGQFRDLSSASGDRTSG